MSPFALCPAMSRDAALAGALLSPVGTRHRAAAPGSPAQPLAFHCRKKHRRKPINVGEKVEKALAVQCLDAKHAPPVVIKDVEWAQGNAGHWHIRRV
uniref:Uncharacterized protein n=1 Tax=Sphaerodactylus townsendi TaxID=933632 RepID=A0ACB8FRW8_9SAUR